MDQQNFFEIYTDHANEAKHDAKSVKVGDSINLGKEIRKKKRIKFLASIAAFAGCQTGIVLIFVFTIMKVRTPKFTVQLAKLVETPHFETSPDPYFNFKMNAQLGVKNNNFGYFKFPNSSIIFSYRGATVGQAVVPKTKAGWCSTKELKVVVELSSNGLSNSSFPQLWNDLNSGVLTLKSSSKLKGKVELLSIFEDKKSIYMNCNLTVGVQDKAVRQISCK